MKLETVNSDGIYFRSYGNVREKQNFLQDTEKSGNFEKMSGNFGHLTHVRGILSGHVREFCCDISF